MKRIAIIVLSVLAFAATTFAGEIGVIRELKMLRPALNKFKADRKSLMVWDLDNDGQFDDRVIPVVRGDAIYVYDPGGPVAWYYDFSYALYMEVNVIGFVPFSGILHAIVRYEWDLNNDGTYEVFTAIINTATDMVEYNDRGNPVAILELPSGKPVVLSYLLPYLEQDNIYKVIGELGGGSSLKTSTNTSHQPLLFGSQADYQLGLKFQAETGLRLAYDPDLFDPPGDTDLDGDGHLDIPMLKVESGEPSGVAVRGGDNLDLLWQFSFPEEHKANILKGFHGFADANGDGQKEAIVGDNLAVTLDGSVHLIAEGFQILDVNDVDGDNLEDIIGLNTIDSTIAVYGYMNPTSVSDYDPVEIHFRLFQNYPNPFNPSTVISFQLPVSSEMRLVIYNTIGQQVRTLVNERKAAGEYSLPWDGRDDAGVLMSSGPYFYRLKAGEVVQTRRMLFLK